jgi:LmbE family N-acetylglucosaminyl deacetylase
LNILVVAAHPDDEVLGCGGTVAQDSARHEVRVAILGEGISSRHAQRSDVSPAQIDNLKSDARAAATILGATSVDFGGLPDNRFDEVPLITVAKQVEEWVDAYRPDVIYTHHPGDLNVDHGLAFRAVLTATRPGTRPHTVRDIMSFEVPSSTEWAFQHIGPPFRPNVFVDIGDSMERKLEAMRCYESEVRQSPHPRAIEKIKALAEHRGAACGMRYAEAFELIRSVRTPALPRD